MSLHLSEPLTSSEFPRVHRHHSHQSHLADQDPSAAGNQVRSLKPYSPEVEQVVGLIHRPITVMRTKSFCYWI